jgi:hypothetical protein
VWRVEPRASPTRPTSSEVNDDQSAAVAMARHPRAPVIKIGLNCLLVGFVSVAFASGLDPNRFDAKPAVERLLRSATIVSVDP